MGFALILIGAIGLLAFSFFQFNTISMNAASLIAERYVTSLNNLDLAVGEIMEFEQNFYIIYYEKTTGIGAFEMLIDKITGRIFPEYGPNMMWNIKYGHGGVMGGLRQQPLGEMPINQDQATSLAQEFLEYVYPGTVADDPHPFYGYYTYHVVKDGDVYGMLSVNGYNGEVWHHNWHGTYIQTQETH
jgi:hypothetical protein